MSSSARRFFKSLRQLLQKLPQLLVRQVRQVISLRRTQAQTAQDKAASEVLQLGVKAYASVIIPALNEAARIASVVSFALADPATFEVIVIDDSSIDDTANLARQAGARVLTSSMLGKGASMHDGVAAAKQPLLVYLDGDLAGLRSGIISELCAPLLRGDADFVKACFARGGGRVTELTAKPMLKIFFPELAHFHQPLGGVIAARKSLLQALELENDFGVDIGLLLDAHLAGARLVELDIGSLEHDSQPLQDLTLMANEVSRVIFSRAKAVGRLNVEQVTAMYEAQRLAAAEVELVLTRRRGRTRLLLLVMDGTVTAQPFAQALAAVTGQTDALNHVLSDSSASAATQSARIAKLFQYVHKTKFEQVARSIAIRPGLIECVNQLRRNGFMVGVLSDSYFVAAEIVRRRIFADFALAHTVGFEHDVSTGQLRINSAFVRPAADGTPTVCKSNALRRLLEDPQPPAITLTWAVSSKPIDHELLRIADKAFCVGDVAPWALELGATKLASFDDLPAHLPAHLPVTS